MKLDQNTLEHLKGNRFTNSLTIQYDYKQAIPKRIDLLCELAKGKNVIHLGCLDHLPLIDEKMARGQWLHKELTKVAANCIGIDVNEEALALVKSKYQFNNILLGDFTTKKFPELTGKQWNYAILGELLEHIDNPVSFLTSIHENYKENLERIVITVPNAWTQHTIKGALVSKEVINSDHRYWFTPYTIAQVIMRAGFELEDILFANRIPLTTAELIQRKVMRMAGIEPTYNFTYASSIVAIAKLRK
jgi:2-polyprenyl-3-methyl-5-hydroxy-6-metoxy-1,4-benzoquinol methylase